MTKVLHFLQTRRFQFGVLPLLILGWFVWTDPSGGADTALRVQLWAQALLITGLSYLVSKAMLGSSSSEVLYRQAVMGNRAAGFAYVGVCVLRGMILLGLLLFFAQVQR